MGKPPSFSGPERAKGKPQQPPAHGLGRLDQHTFDRIEAVGPFGRDRYLDYLHRADIVVSCARHDFFGLGVAEAMAAGCIPVLPNALAYPELIGDQWHQACLYERGQFGTRLIEVVSDLDRYRLATTRLAMSMSRFGWGKVAARLDEVLDDALGR